MAKTQNGNGKKGDGNGNGNNHENIIGNDALKTMEQTGEPPKAPRSEEAKLDKRFLQVSEQSCVASLEKALGFNKAALHLEAAVALALFCFSVGGADRETKRYAMDLYGKAGYDTDPKGEDYKTINRRVNAFASLYVHEGRPVFINAMEGETEDRAIEALKNFLTTEYNFRSINDILALAGKAPKQYATSVKNVAQPARQAAEQPDEGGVPAEAGETGKPTEGEIRATEKAIEARAEEGKEPTGKQEEIMAAAGEQAPAPEAPRLSAPEASAPEASPEDKATAAKLGERMENRRESDRRQAPSDFKRRKEDLPNAVIFRTEHIHVALPRDVPVEEVKEIALQLLAFAAELEAKQAESRRDKGKRHTTQTSH